MYTFYEQLSSTISKDHSRDIIILPGDFNAKIGSANNDTSFIMGKHGIWLMDNAFRFTGFCQDYKLVIVGSIFPIKPYVNIHHDGRTWNQTDHICINKYIIHYQPKLFIRLPKKHDNSSRSRMSGQK